MQEKIYHHGLNNSLLTKEQQDEMFRELNRMQQERMQHFARLLENDSRLVSQATGFRYESAKFNLSALEERVSHLPLHTLFADKGPDVTTVTGRVRAEHVSDRLIHGGIVSSAVHRYPRISDNLPKGTIKLDGSDANVRISQSFQSGDDWFRAMAFGLTMDQMGVIEIDSVPKGSDVIVDYKTVGGPIRPQQLGRALRINREPVWQSTKRDRAATPATVRKKLRTKTRAQKKARRKQR